jgi:enoyl-CoA hydratase
MGLEFTAAVNHMNTLAADQSIRSCIITGSGHAFSAGGDLAWLRERHDSTPYQNRLTMLKFYNLYLHVRTLTVPTIAAINGHAIGAGMCMTLGCDFRVASKDARLGFTFVKLGIHPGIVPIGLTLLPPFRIVVMPTVIYLQAWALLFCYLD